MSARSITALAALLGEDSNQASRRCRARFSGCRRHNSPVGVGQPGCRVAWIAFHIAKVEDALRTRPVKLVARCRPDRRRIRGRIDGHPRGDLLQQRLVAASLLRPGHTRSQQQQSNRQYPGIALACWARAVARRSAPIASPNSECRSHTGVRWTMQRFYVTVDFRDEHLDRSGRMHRHDRRCICQEHQHRAWREVRERVAYAAQRRGRCSVRHNDEIGVSFAGNAVDLPARGHPWRPGTECRLPLASEPRAQLAHPRRRIRSQAIEEAVQFAVADAVDWSNHVHQQDPAVAMAQFAGDTERGSSHRSGRSPRRCVRHGHLRNGQPGRPLPRPSTASRLPGASARSGPACAPSRQRIPTRRCHMIRAPSPPPMTWNRRYLVALLLVAASLLLRLSLQSWLGDKVPFLQFFPAVMLAAWFGGFGPGVVAVGASAALAVYFFLPPTGGPASPILTDSVSLALFVLTGVGIAWFNHRLRSAEGQREAAATWAVLEPRSCRPSWTPQWMASSSSTHGDASRRSTAAPNACSAIRRQISSAKTSGC